MIRSRWTTLPALAILAIFLVPAIPARRESPHAGAALAARAGAPAADPRRPRIVVLGIDGLDPDILREVMDEHPERMQSFRRLAQEGQGVLALATSTPPQSPVAWSNFITGRNPGGHGIFDFIHRDPRTYAVASATVTPVESKTLPLPGNWQFPIESGGDTNRSGEAFWTVLARHGVPADVWRMPINFPVEPSDGWSFSGMMTPAVDSAYGEYSFYSTDPPAAAFGTGTKVFQIVERGGLVRTRLFGPANAFKEGQERAQVPLVLHVDREMGAVAVELEGSPVLVLEPGEWSEFVPVSFGMLPMGMMDMGGVVRFYLRSIEPELELYASPINLDPRAPLSPVSAPEEAAAELADEIGTYYTQGMAEDVGSLKQGILTDEEFMRQSNLVHAESWRMLDVALDRFQERGGLLFFYHSGIDLCSHMMWRHGDEQHPHHDADFAARDSSWWSEREGSHWREVVEDLYLRMDPVLGRIRERAGDGTTVVVMSDHGFASYRRKFNLNTWLLENGYLVLNEGQREKLDAGQQLSISLHGLADPPETVDWSSTRAYGIGFNGLYLNLRGREAQGAVDPADAPALLAELKEGLEALRDGDGTQVVTAAELASEVYTGERLAEAPDLLVGYNAGYGNSDEAAQGFLEKDVLADNLGGTFNGSHLMDPRVVPGTLLTNARVANEAPRLEDLTVELLRQYGVQPDESMDGRPVFH